MMPIWMIEDCEKCSGSGWSYCSKCETICDHDRLCPKCGGAGQMPKKKEGFAAMVAVTFEHFNSRRQAQSEIDRWR
jgi:DnaJ-class molecular chaperone